MSRAEALSASSASRGRRLLVADRLSVISCSARALVLATLPRARVWAACCCGFGSRRCSAYALLLLGERSRRRSCCDSYVGLIRSHARISAISPTARSSYTFQKSSSSSAAKSTVALTFACTLTDIACCPNCSELSVSNESDLRRRDAHDEHRVGAAAKGGPRGAARELRLAEGRLAPLGPAASACTQRPSVVSELLIATASSKAWPVHLRLLDALRAGEVNETVVLPFALPRIWESARRRRPPIPY